MADRYRWWRVSKVNGQKEVYGTIETEDLAREHQMYMMNGDPVGQVYVGTGPDRPGSDFSGPFSIDWLTVEGVNEIPEALATRLLVPSLRALNEEKVH